MKRTKTLLASLGGALAVATILPSVAVAQADNIVLVHGMNMDGGAWRTVYRRLTARGYDVTAVQLPMTSIEADIAATHRAINAQEGSVVLVGHSYGGMVISQAGTDTDVKALVYVAAFQPEIGESIADLNASIPADMPQDAVQLFDDGYYVVERSAWIADVANGVPEADAQYTAMFQTPANTSIFAYEAETTTWHEANVWAAIATEDRVIAPELQRQMSERSGATVVEVEGGHLLPISHPSEITSLIEEAAISVN